MVWIWQALYGRHLRWHEMRKPRKIREKNSSEVGACFGPRFEDRFGAGITCDNDLGGSQVVKKGGLETSTENRSD